MRGHGRQAGSRDDHRYTECYDIDTQLRMLRFEPNSPLVRARRMALVARWYGLKHYWGYPPPGRMWLRKLGGDRVLPDFACVGSIKSGTSDLATNLFSHPSIVPPFAKEVFNTDPEVWRAY
ncbi:hypothetical protein C6V83_16065 [Gordonia iterans]|uniref:Sulfotransferase domain-containing protein n=1 Tax=Gordonia iterans TaxID=1004901 RepID=A0A2S0KIQ7_9ACTN|nr:hypothetical protein [Gordonia iterans]AVM01536.1 hypothetical protein C6V83_16065 [Gordonia iterans]